jgi:hypothetical protein
VAVVTDSGVYSDWVIDSLDVGKSTRLEPKVAAKFLPGSPGGPANTFLVRVQWAVPGGETAEQWLRSPPLPAGLEE